LNLNSNNLSFANDVFDSSSLLNAGQNRISDMNFLRPQNWPYDDIKGVSGGLPSNPISFNIGNVVSAIGTEEVCNTGCNQKGDDDHNGNHNIQEEEKYIETGYQPTFNDYNDSFGENIRRC